jgi:hypothetical protein
VRAEVVAPLAARDGTARDVLASVSGDDRSYLTFITNDDRGIVDFPCPAQVGGTTRTVFARTKGWYEIRVRESGLPDLAEIERVTNQPGYVVQLALRSYRKQADRWLAQMAPHASTSPERN